VIKPISIFSIIGFISVALLSTGTWAAGNSPNPNCARDLVAGHEQTQTLVPAAVQEAYPAFAKSQPLKIKIDNQDILFHNPKLAELISGMKEGPTQSDITHLFQQLSKNGALDLPLSPSGLLPAAQNGNHGGGYGKYAWLRDLARALIGKRSLPKLLENSLTTAQDKIKAFFTPEVTKKLSQEQIVEFFTGLVMPAQRSEIENVAKATNDVQRMYSAVLNLFALPDQTARLLRNISDPSYILTAHDAGPLVRIPTSPVDEQRPMTEVERVKKLEWAHKQNDALALYAHAILDGFKKNDLSLEQISSVQQAQLLYLVSYFQRVNYIYMPDAGSWEEGYGVRTSSISLVTSLLERFQAGMHGRSGNAREQDFFDKLQLEIKSGRLKKSLASTIEDNPVPRSGESVPVDELWKVIEDSTGINGAPYLDQTLRKAEALLRKRFGIDKRDSQGKFGPVVEVEANGVDARGLDAAILHAMLYPPPWMTIEERLHVIDSLKSKLMKNSGFNRYQNDWFIHSARVLAVLKQERESRESTPDHSVFKMSPDAVNAKPFFDPNMIVIWDGREYRQSNQQERDAIAQMHNDLNRPGNKDISAIVARMGEDLDSRWTFQDFILVQIYTQLFRETQDPEFRKLAWFHLARGLGTITGENEIDIEGYPMKSWRVPEAWVPLHMVHEGKFFTVFFASPNSPLNWSIAEMITALSDYYGILPDPKN
jgi:hypothetical protein